MTDMNGVVVFTFDDVPAAPSADAVRQTLASIRPGDYVAFLSYLPGATDIENTVAEIRKALRARTRAASTFGLGPRYLHSTGQYHKGGPNTCVAFVLTADDESATPVGQGVEDAGEGGTEPLRVLRHELGIGLA